MKDLVIPAILSLFYYQTSAETTVGIWWAIERFGVPTVFLVVLWWQSYKQNEKRLQEARQFWSDNNAYLRELIREYRLSGSCKFEK